MKRDAPNNSKMKRLCRLLDIPLYQAIGILELLWHLTAREAPRGDIGKLSNEDIALSLDYRRDPDQLIDGLVQTKWLDVDSEHRLCVHDWAEHADEAVKKRLTRSGQSFVSSRHVETRQPNVETKRQSGKLPRAGAGPEPEPVPVPAPSQNKKRSGDKAPVTDARHWACRDHVHAYWRRFHPGADAAPWGPAEGQQLKLLLSTNPKLTADEFLRLLDHRARSEVNHSARPLQWLAKLTDFTRSPLDRFNKPKGEDDGTHTSSESGNGIRGAAVGRVERSKQAFRAAALASIEASGGFDAGPDGERLALTGTAPGHGGYVSTRGRDVGGGIRVAEDSNGSGIIFDAAEVLPPSQRSTREVGSYDF